MKNSATDMNKGDKRHKRPKKASEEDLYYRRTDGGNFTNNLSNGVPSEMDQKPIAIHQRPRVPRKSGRRDHVSDLNTAFDPMKDLHMWTMWRTAVNGRIVDEVRRLEKAKSETPPPPRDIYGNVINNPSGDNLAYAMPSPHYGKALSGAPPLSRFIRLDDHSKNVAQSLVREGQGQLKTSQFIYYGLPRVMVNADRDIVQEPQRFHSLHPHRM